VGEGRVMWKCIDCGHESMGTDAGRDTPHRCAQPADPEAAAVWERLTPAQRAAITQPHDDVSGGPRVSAEEPALGCSMATLRVLERFALVEFQGYSECGWWAEPTDLGRRVAAHGRREPSR
jgi:hypothetical protein